MFHFLLRNQDCVLISFIPLHMMYPGRSQGCGQNTGESVRHQTQRPESTKTCCSTSHPLESTNRQMPQTFNLKIQVKFCYMYSYRMDLFRNHRAGHSFTFKLGQWYGKTLAVIFYEAVPLTYHMLHRQALQLPPVRSETTAPPAFLARRRVCELVNAAVWNKEQSRGGLHSKGLSRENLSTPSCI